MEKKFTLTAIVKDGKLNMQTDIGSFTAIEIVGILETRKFQFLVDMAKESEIQSV
jgi:hypothetical protein